jgi:hypothetical protein
MEVYPSPAEGIGLENRQGGQTPRGFESLYLLHLFLQPQRIKLESYGNPLLHVTDYFIIWMKMIKKGRARERGYVFYEFGARRSR